LSDFKHSNSSVNSFITCPYSYKQLYVDRIPTRANNYYGQFGSVMHKVLELYLKKEIDLFSIEDHYNQLYNEFITCNIPMGSAESYYTAGLNFFKYLSFLVDNYDIIAIEKRLEFSYFGIDVVCVPDLILREKATGKYILFDYKTSSAKTEKECVVKVKKEHYDRQAYLYVWAIWESMDIAIDEIKIWFLRPNIVTDLQWNQEDIDLTRDWFVDTIELIEKESEWKANNENAFWCNFLCSARANCLFKKET